MTRPVRSFGKRLLAVAALACLAGCERPPLRVRRTSDTFLVDVQTLGEYQTSVARIRLTRGHEVVWEVVARDRIPQLHTFVLRVGANPGLPQQCGGGETAACDRPWASEAFAVVTPARGGSFRVEPGTRYELEVWGAASRWSRASVSLSP